MLSTARILAIVVLLAWMPLALASSLTFHDRTPKDSPCDVFAKIPWSEFREALSEVVGDKAGVVKAINDQLDGVYKKAGLPKKEGHPLADPGVEVFFVTLEEFQEERSNDLTGEKEELKKRAKQLWDKFDAYTYPTKDKKIKVKIFCKDRTLAATNGNATRHELYRLIVHEFVHAKIEAMRLAGVETLPLNDNDKNAPKEHKEDHNPDFSKEVDRLVEKLLKELGKG